MKCANEECSNEFEQTYWNRKYCCDKCRKQTVHRRLVEFRSNPFKTARQSAFEPTDINTFFESEEERRKKRPKL